MAEQAQLEDADIAMESDDEEGEKAAILLEIHQNKMIAQSVVPHWDDLGTELDLDDGVLATINQNANQRPVIDCAKQMLITWWKTQPGANPDQLITALKKIDQNNYAARLEKALRNGITFNQKYLRNTVAKEIAPYWYDLGLQLLDVKKLNSIQNIDNPTQYKFDRMLEVWVGGQTCTKHEMYKKIHKALIALELNRDAEEFHGKAFGDIN